MILVIECIGACLLFGLAIVGSVLYKRTAWLNEYAPEVQKRFLEKNPDYKPKTKKGNIVSIIISKVIVCVILIAVLTLLVYLSGARNFITGAGYCYTIWFVVNLFDVVVLDIGIFAHWKRVRLPGTENMDKEYSSNMWKSIKDGLFGIVIGIPVAIIIGSIIMLTTK